MYICPKCGSASVSVERRIDGDATCSYCGFKGKAVTFLTRKVQQLEAVRQEKVQHLDDIGQVIQDTRDVYEKGGIEGIIIIIKNKEEGCTQTAICGNISPHESIGMLEYAKYDFLLKSSCPFFMEED